MFLTTNRVTQIDDAIASRIYFKLKYNNLNLEQRTNIWRDFLGRAATPPGVPIYSRDNFDSWVRKERNGREVGSSFTCSRSKLITVLFRSQTWCPRLTLWLLKRVARWPYAISKWLLTPPRISNTISKVRARRKFRMVICNRPWVSSRMNEFRRPAWIGYMTFQFGLFMSVSGRTVMLGLTLISICLCYTVFPVRLFMKA